MSGNKTERKTKENKKYLDRKRSINKWGVAPAGNVLKVKVKEGVLTEAQETCFSIIDRNFLNNTEVRGTNPTPG